MKSSRSSKIVSTETVQKVAAQAKCSTDYLTLMSMAGALAAVALLTNSVPILIGAMVVAPALNPIGLIALALINRQPRLALRGLWTTLAGLLLATVFAILTTWIMNVTSVIPPETNLFNKPLLEERVNPGWYSVAAAIAAGVAGAIALVQQKTDTLVGVVASLALVPAAAAAGIAFLSGDPVRTFGGLVLLGINVSLIILMSIVTLLIVRPDQQK